jgi:hypothetical protein
MDGREPNNDIETEQKEPTIEELIEALRGTLTDEDCEDLASMDLDEALDNAFTMLEVIDIDPVIFLMDKGILQSEK